MIDFLKQWKLGINMIAITINIQSPKFDHSTQVLIQLINDFFNDPNIWNQAALVFTKCYRGFFDKNIALTLYRTRVIEYIKQLPRCGNINPFIPCFFVDSVNWKQDLDTQSEIIRMVEFCFHNPPMTTQKLELVNPSYKTKEEEILNKILVKTENANSDNETIYYYEDQKRYKITDRNGKVFYTKPEIIKSWTEIKFTKIQEEKKIEVHEILKPIYKLKQNFFQCVLTLEIIPPSKKELDHYIKEKTFIEYKRNIFIDPNGNVTFSEWTKSREWIEEDEIF